MKALGIIAAHEERMIPYPKWYQFWKKRSNYEVIGIENNEIELTVAYLPRKTKKYIKWIDQTKELFAGQGIYHIVGTKRAGYQKELECSDFRIHKGNELIVHMIPKIIAKIAKMKDLNLQQATIAYVDDAYSQYTDQLLHNLSQKCRYLQLITKNKEKAAPVSNVLLEEYGIPIDLLYEERKKIECDFAILMNGKMPKVPINAVIIDTMSKGFYEGRKTIHSIDLILEESITKALPFSFHNTEILQALWKIGALKYADIDRAKVGKMYFNGNNVDFLGKT